MNNPLYQQFNQNNPMQMIQKFQEFKNQFQGNPQQMVQQLLASGKMSQAQYNQLVQMANQLYPRFK